MLALALTLIRADFARSDEPDDDEDDHDRALQALEGGLARPLSRILDNMGDRLGGEVIGVKFERKDERWIYELKVITPAGRLREVHVDALTAEIVRDEEDE